MSSAKFLNKDTEQAYLDAADSAEALVSEIGTIITTIRKETLEAERQKQYQIVLQLCDDYDDAIRKTFGEDAIETVRKMKTQTLTDGLKDLSSRIQNLKALKK
jgi:hypothetical protein